MLTLEGTIATPSPLAASAIKVAGAPLSNTIGGLRLALWHSASNHPRDPNDRCSNKRGTSARLATSTEDLCPSGCEEAITAKIHTGKSERAANISLLTV